jgi:hypothetical protein
MNQTYIRPTFAIKPTLSPRGRREAALAIARIRGAWIKLHEQRARVLELALPVGHPTTEVSIRMLDAALQYAGGQS